ncbi:SPASM domain-containing protein [Selenomonadales bacterium OttesenSCG-928-I06]|nr:SPASM domain-containing protein [Selenomonadales bacterium OttesenSCG-928-I06]
MSWIDKYFERYLDYPIEVTIETTGRCNARCIFCPHNELDRKNLDMSDDLFMRIIEGLEEIPREHIFYISPFKVNEFLMDKEIFAKIEIINERLPNAYIRLFSNFNAATEADILKICQIKNLSDIDISINSLDSEEYKALMGLNLARTLNNIFKFLECIRQQPITINKNKITLSRVAQSPETDQRFLKSFSDIFEKYSDLVIPQVIPRGEWIDFMPNEKPLRQEQSCMRWADVNICCTGIVAFCCMDGRGAYPLGDVRENTILEIYNQPSYRRLREERLLKNQVVPCKYCSQ